MLQCYVEGRNLVAGVEKRYDIADGAVFVDNYNETLDSATIKIMQLSSEIQIEPYDIVVVMGAGTTKRYCVDTYTCTQTSLKPEIYQYDISLFSETKLLEGVICPNLAITKLFSAIPRSVSYYLQLYIDLYSPKTQSDPELGAYGNKFIVLPETIARFNNVQCPEMQWNQPTLREVLTDLMMVDDCIPVLKSNQLGYLSIGTVGSEISQDQKNCINYIQKTQSSEDYVSEIRMKIVNAANNTRPEGGVVPSDSTHIVEEIGFRNDDVYLLDTNNMTLQTSLPIWNLYYASIKLTVSYTAKVYSTILGMDPPFEDVSGTITIEMPLTDYILEYGEWQTKPIYYSWWAADHSLSTDYQNTCLYYIRGGRNIRNFIAEQQSSPLYIPDRISVFELILSSDFIKDKIKEDALTRVSRPEYYDDPHIESTDMPSWKQVVFKVSYDALDECPFQVSKTPFPRNNRIIIDNQTNSYVDLNRMGFLEYMKANRLGNKMILANGRYPTGGVNIPELAQKINDKIIFKRELAYYKHHIDANFLATENYVLKNYFTGVKSKVRSWKFIEGSEALTRMELVKFYVNERIPSVANAIRLIPSYSSIDYYLEAFNYCVIQFLTSDGRRPEDGVYSGITYNTPGLMVEFTKHRVADSVVFTIKMADNIFAGRYINTYSGGPTSAYTQQTPIKYTDDNGEFVSCVICFYRQFDPNIWLDEQANRALKPLSIMPKSGEPGSQQLVAQIPVTIHKDNKEIFQISIQFELNEYANDMFLGQK